MASKIIDDHDWGCVHSELIFEEERIKVCIIQVNVLEKIARELTSLVLNTSWMLELDKRTQRSYRVTVQETADALVQILNETKINPSPNGKLGADFGEIMVSMGASRALSKIFDHSSLPIAELWKPQKKQNEGFDFHTVCPNFYINFGEAKYSGQSNPHGEAINQISDFLNAEKHLREAIHLEKITCSTAVNNLDDDIFGAIAAFSVNSLNYEKIIKNAIDSILEKELLKKCHYIYVVGVICN